jgi:hypothetical protein
MNVVKSLVVAAFVAVPALSFAQSNQPLTRAEVRAQLVELQKAGYNPVHEEASYPQDILAALARIDTQNGVASSYGPSSDGTSASGSPVSHREVAGLRPLYSQP